MNKIIASIGEGFFNVLSQEEQIHNQIDFSNFQEIEFDPGYKLEADEIFVINDFSNTDYSIEITQEEEITSANYLQLERDQFEHIKFICIIQGDHRYFQRIIKDTYVRNKRVIDCSPQGTPRIVELTNHIAIRKQSDAIYNSATNKLYFRKTAPLKVIFNNIIALVKQATQEEVNSFTASEFLCLQGRFNPEKVGQANRKRIADIGAKFNSLPTGKQTRLIQYARENAGIEFEDDNFKIESDKDLKNLLFALDQRYYYADILDENRVANSVRLASES